MGATLASCHRESSDAWPALELAEEMALVLPAGGLRPFFLQRFEVTNAEFARFVAETGYRRIDGRPFSFEPGADRPLDLRERGDHPVTWSRRDEARDYLKWLGLRLPASQEWSEAAKAHVLSAPETSANDEVISLYTANSRETKVGGTVPVGFFEGDRTRSGIYDLAGNVREWTEGVVLAVERGEWPYLLAEPESYRQVLLDFAELGGLPERDAIAAAFDQRARLIRYVKVQGQSWSDELLPRGTAVRQLRTEQVTAERLLHRSDALDVVGFRGACDALAMLDRLGREAEGRSERLARLAAWIERLPPDADGVMRRLLRERGDALPAELARLVRARLGN